jgi:hypothetical protein
MRRVPVTLKALLQRLDRALTREGRKLKKSRGLHATPA